MQWEERCRYFVSRLAARIVIAFIAFFVAFMGESVSVSAQDVVSTIGDLSDECESNPEVLGVVREDKTLTYIIGFVFGVAVFLIILSVLGTLAMQNDKNIYYKSTTRFDNKDAS
ncbi:MAG: hypothetical protein J5802_01250 [Butyrivibrio sp.]|nr:hypothetical protein [Butyrivibrio sp.]